MERSDNIGTPKLFEEHLQEQMRRVLQSPKIRKIIAGPKGKIDLSEQTDRNIILEMAIEYSDNRGNGIHRKQACREAGRRGRA